MSMAAHSRRYKPHIFVRNTAAAPTPGRSKAAAIAPRGLLMSYDVFLTALSDGARSAAAG